MTSGPSESSAATAMSALSLPLLYQPGVHGEAPPTIDTHVLNRRPAALPNSADRIFLS